MARPLRIDFPGALHHVTSRGNERRDIFLDDVDRSMFLTLLGRAVHRFRWSLSAWVLMTNHFHLVIHTPEANLSRGMQWLAGTYAGWFNRRHKRVGHLFQGRFHSFLVEKETYFREVLRYVVLNPVRAGMVSTPGEYRWSSFASTAGHNVALDWLDVPAALDLFDHNPDHARALYEGFVLARIDSTQRLWNEAVNGIYLGSESWAKQMRSIVESKPRSTDHPRAHRAVGRPMIQTIVAAVENVARASADEIRTLRGNPLRRLVAWLGWHEGLVTLRSIAAALRLRSEGHVSSMIRRCEREFGENAVLLRQLDSALATLRG